MKPSRLIPMNTQPAHSRIRRPGACAMPLSSAVPCCILAQPAPERLANAGTPCRAAPKCRRGGPLWTLVEGGSDEGVRENMRPGREYGFIRPPAVAEIREYAARHRIGLTEEQAAE